MRTITQQIEYMRLRCKRLGYTPIKVKLSKPDITKLRIGLGCTGGYPDVFRYDGMTIVSAEVWLPTIVCTYKGSKVKHEFTVYDLSE